jgi:exopolysaccharide biosynthesis polyprenyl glycosylphosphotransferase
MLRFIKYRYGIAASELIMKATAITLFTCFFIVAGKSAGHLNTFLMLFIILHTFLLVYFLLTKLSKVDELNLDNKRRYIIALYFRRATYIVIISVGFLFVFSKGYFVPGMLIVYSLLISVSLLFFVSTSSSKKYSLDELSEIKNDKCIVIIGDGKAGKKLSHLALNDNLVGVKIKGIIDGNSVNKSVMDDLIQNNSIDEILISCDDGSYDELMRIMDLCYNYKIKLKLASDLFRVVLKKKNIEEFYGIPVVTLNQRVSEEYYLAAKRLFDVVLSFIGLLVLTPLFAAIMISIKVTSQGPVFYKQKRVGLNGRLFDLYKFRSMHSKQGTDIKREKMMLSFMKENAAHKVIDDTRVTKVGKFIRRTSLDELPQLYNVIKGDMSIVGPRPCLPYEFNNYEEWQKRRVEVIPGCTGIWQVSGRSTVSFIDSVVLDLYYIITRSLWVDFKLFMKTIPVMLFSKGGI